MFEEKKRLLLCSTLLTEEVGPRRYLLTNRDVNAFFSSCLSGQSLILSEREMVSMKSKRLVFCFSSEWYLQTEVRKVDQWPIEFAVVV